MLAPTTASFAILGPNQPATPVVIGVPHAGRYYPPSVLARARVGREVLERLEDRYVDHFAQGLADAGHRVVVAHVARAAIDLNRDVDEWESGDVVGTPARPARSQRSRVGLGLIPRRLHDVGDLWRHRLDPIELDHLIARAHQPYHAAIAAALDAARAAFGAAVFLDLHSMPTQIGGRPDLVLGDRFGETASAQLVDGLLGVATQAGYDATRNLPYAGAYGVATHGARRRRAAGVEAVQIELDRRLYLDPSGEVDDALQGGVAQMLRDMAQWAGEYAHRRGGQAIAAE